MAPSQLSQLRNALSSAGLSRNSPSQASKSKSKGKGKAGFTTTDREKKEARLNAIKVSLNKFDVREEKVKNPVVGPGVRKVKGVVGTPSQSRSRGLELRKQSLLPEHELRRSGHTGTFLDKRFGESNPHITPEERALERFTRTREAERSSGGGGGGGGGRSGKKGVFNLNDDNDEGLGFGDDDDDGTMHLGSTKQSGSGSGSRGGFTLTHGGRSVVDLKGDDFDAQGLGDDEDDLEDDFGFVRRGGDEDEEMNGGGENRRRGRFEGDGGEEEPDRKKTKAEIMAEVVAKSKHYKHERQLQKDTDEDLRLQLDDDIDDLRELLASSAPKNAREASKSFYPKAVDVIDSQGQGSSSTRENGALRPATVKGGEDGLDYDQQVRALAFEARAKPKDRSKTEDELALEEKEKLEAAEKARLRRMRGEEEEELGSDGDEEGASGSRRKNRRAKGKEVERNAGAGARRIPEGDDLDDDFVDEQEENGGIYGLGNGIREVGAAGDDGEDGEDDEEEDGEGDPDEEDDDDEEDEDEDEGSDLMSGEDDLMTEEETEAPRRYSKRGTTSTKSKEIPFTFKCPASHEDLLDIMDGLEDKDITTVVQRVRTLYHPSLGEGNKERLEVLLGILLEHFLYLGETSPMAFQISAALFPHINALVKLNPIAAAENFRSQLQRMQKTLTKRLASSANDVSTTATAWPGIGELIVLRYVGLIWSTSDFSNPVSAPAQLLMGQYLAQCRLKSLSDVTAGLFLCSLFLQYESYSKRITPEVLNFLSMVILVLRPKGGVIASAPGLFPLGGLQMALLEDLRLKTKAAVGLKVTQPDLQALLGPFATSGAQDKINLLAMTLQLVDKSAENLAGLDSFIELFEPVHSIISEMTKSSLPRSLQEVAARHQDSLSRRLKFARQARQPLQMQDHKPMPIATYAPKFEADFSMGKRYDPDAERNEANKVKALYKKERKGAIRELRKDNRFLAQQKSEERKAKDEAYEKRMRTVHGSIGSERAEEKAMEREKKKLKRRAGGK